MKYNSVFVGIAAALIGLLATACSEDSPENVEPVPDEPTETTTGTFAKGADVSWVTELEALGYKFQNQSGVEKELMTLLRDDCGVNAIRLRVWVNPENDPVVQGWCDINDVVVKARRAHALGLRLMIDFHFSDTWADPGQQTIPAAWADMTISEVEEAMANHIGDLLSRLDSYGIDPEWVQIGNETRTGMMWPLGNLSNGDNFTRMVNAGYKAVKAYFPDCQVIVHCDSGNELWLYTNLFGKLKTQGANYDMIGMSLYPGIDTWEKDVNDCISNVRTVQSTYGKPVMICEIGMDYRESEIAAKMMEKVVTEGQSIDLKGVFWWEPEAPASRGYTKGCFDDGAPTAALDAFKN